MSSSSENKDFRQLENYFNIILDPSSSENQIMNIRSKIGLILFFCCIKDPMRTLNNIIQKMESIDGTPGISIILLSCACYALQFFPHLNLNENSSKLTSLVEAPLLRHAVFEDSNNMYNLSRFLQAGGAKMLPCPDVFLCELILHHEIIGTSITAKPIALLIDLNPERNSSIFWQLFNPQYETIDEIFMKNEPLMTLISKVVACSNILPPTDEDRLNILLKSCEHNCLMLTNNENLESTVNSSQNNENIKEDQKEENSNQLKINDKSSLPDTNNNNSNEIKSDRKQFKFHYVEISLTILRWLISNKLYCPDCLSMNYGNVGLDCLVVECWSEYAKYGDLSKLPKFDRSDRSMQSIYIKIIKNALLNPNFTFESISVNHWLWREILQEFTFSKQKNFDVATVNSSTSKHSIYELTSNELMNISDIASILPEWFFIHCLRFKCRNTEISARLLSIVNDLPTTILVSNYEDFIDFIMYHITTFPQNAHLVASCLRDLVAALLPRMNRLIERIVESIDYFDESNLSPRILVLNSIFCFGVEADSFADVLDNLIEAIPLLEGTISLSLSQSMFKFFSLMTFYVKKHGEILFNIAMAVVCATYSTCASALVASANPGASAATGSGSNSNNNSGGGISGASSSSSATASLGSSGGRKNMQIRRTMSAVQFKMSSSSSSSTTSSPLAGSSDWSSPPRGATNNVRSVSSPPQHTGNSSLSINSSRSINDCALSQSRDQFSGGDSILVSGIGNSIGNGGGSSSITSTTSSEAAAANFAQSGLDFSPIEEPSFVQRCEQSHTIYLSCLRFYSVASSDVIVDPEFRPSGAFPLTPLALQLISKLPQSQFGKDLEGLSMLIDFLPSFLPLFPFETISLANFLIEAGALTNGKTLSLFCAHLNRELSHNDSFNFVLQVMHFVAHITTIAPNESIVMGPINVKTLSDDIDSTRQALQSYPEIIPLIVMKGTQLSLLLELTAPKIDNSMLVALSVKLEQSKSGHEIRQIRSFLSHFSFKQPDYFTHDSWLRRDFGVEEHESEGSQISKENMIVALSKIGSLNKKEEEDDDEGDRLIGTFSKFYPVDLKLDKTELIVSIAKSYKLCSSLSGIVCSIVSTRLNECVRFGKDKFWFIKFLFSNGVKFDFPEDTENQKCIEFGLRNGFLPRSLIVALFKLDITENSKEDDQELNSEKKEEETSNDNEQQKCFNDSSELEKVEEPILDDVEDWMWIDRLYLLLPSEIEEIWSTNLVNKGRILSSLFLPKQAIVPKDFLIKLITTSSSLPSTIYSLNSNITLNQPNSASSSLSSFSTLPSSVCQHILEYLFVFASSSSDEAEQFFNSNENAIANFITRIDIHNQLVFESLFTFVSSRILMLRGDKKKGFVIKFAEVFLKIVFSSEAGIYSSCLYEVLPMLKKILDAFHAYGKKFKPNDPFVQFLMSLKKGLPSLSEYIPDSIVE